MMTFKIYTLGCKVNQYESQSIRESLINSSAIEENKNLKSDIYVINTCTVTSSADRDSLYLINRSIKENPHAKIIVTGCLAEKDKDKILDKFGDSVEIVKKNDKWNIGISDFKGYDKAFLKIQDGCDNFCSYCKVPYVRGKSKSRPLNEIIEEAKRFVDKGFKEIVLTGICLGSYGKDLSPKSSLVKALKALSKIKNISRMRLSSIEVKDVNNNLIKLVRDYNFICKHLHIPLQSGDDEILKKMNRKFLTKDFLKLINGLRREIPQIAITTDVIVGFPSEEKKNFINTLNFIKKIKPSRAHIFSYSDRAHTKAESFYPKVCDNEKRERFLQLKEVCNNLSYQYRKKFLNKEAQVLVETAKDKKTGFCTGYTDNYIRVLFSTKDKLAGQLVSLKIIKVTKENTYAKHSN